MSLLVIIPARGGSKRLERKNLLPMRDKPMVIASATSWSLPENSRIVVSTDSDEIASIAKLHQLEVHRRDPVDDDQTVLEASKLVATDLGWTGPVLTVQPTVHPVPYFGTLIKSSVPAVLVRDAPHIWYGPELFEKTTGDFQEMLGVFYWPAGEVGKYPQHAVPLRSWEQVTDIDTPTDYAMAARRSYNINVNAAEASTWNGTGHHRRQLELSYLLQDRGLDDEIPDILILDQGDTYVEDIASYRNDHWGPRIVTFEDRGPGALHADATINSLVANPYSPGNEYKGSDYAFIRSEFLGLKYEEKDTNKNWILIAFGGTDAKQLTARVAWAVKKYSYIPKTLSDFPTVAEAMLSCFVTVSGAGQLVHEAAYLGVPTITMAATLRESAHTHLGPQYGNLYLGYAGAVGKEQFVSALSAVMGDPHLREEMHRKGRRAVDGRGADRILHILEGVMNG